MFVETERKGHKVAHRSSVRRLKWLVTMVMLRYPFMSGNIRLQTVS